MDYIVDVNNDIIGKKGQGNFIGLTVTLPQDLGILFLRKGGYQCYKYTYISGTVVEQKIKSYAFVNANNDIEHVFRTNNEMNVPAGSVEITDVEFDSFFDASNVLGSKVLDEMHRVPAFQHINGAIVEKTEVLDEVGKCEVVLKRINDKIERKIVEKYSPGKEAQLTKNYVEWVAAGQPVSDARETAYTSMQTDISTIKAGHTAEKDTIKAQRDSLSA